MSIRTTFHRFVIWNVVLVYENFSLLRQYSTWYFVPVWMTLHGCIAILCFFFTIIILITSPRTQSGDVLLFYVSFSLLLHHPERSQVTYCYSTFLFHYYYYSYYYYYYSSTHFCPLYFSEMPKGQNFMIIISGWCNNSEKET
jgi:hypothetical protein